MAEAVKGRQLLEKLGSIEVVMQTHTEGIAAPSATIMEQIAQNNEHRRRLSFFWREWAANVSVLEGCCPESSESC